MAGSLKRKSPGSPANSTALTTPSTLPPSSHGLVAVVERSILRSLAFVLYHLDQAQARFCVRSILQWYGQLQRQLPLFAVKSLDKCATSFVALSDAEFTAFWLSLVDEPGVGSGGSRQYRSEEAAELVEYITIHSGDQDMEDATTNTPDEDRDATLLKRLYRQICGRIQRLFGFPPCVKQRDATWHAQTPLTSPDKYDERDLYLRHASMSLAASGDHSLGGALSRALSIEEAERSEPGWAVEYMEQECQVSSEITMRMRRMMHSSVPLNLFRVAVVYPPTSDEDDDGCDTGGGFVGVISPESFPPTPITRDLQTRRIHHYTATVLDHATLALRLLDANCYSG